MKKSIYIFTLAILTLMSCENEPTDQDNLNNSSTNNGTNESVINT